MTTQRLADVITMTPEIEGVTFLGGEPFDQAGELAEVAATVRMDGKSVMVFTGYRYEHLLAGRIVGGNELLAHTDLLVDGPFLADKVDRSRPWLGSTNQRILALTDRYAGSMDTSDRVEVTVATDGTVYLNGWASPEQLAQLKQTVLGPGSF